MELSLLVERLTHQGSRKLLSVFSFRHLFVDGMLQIKSENYALRKLLRNRNLLNYNVLMTSWYGNLFPITGPLLWESERQWWIPLTKARDAEL